jgi:L-amino acid N-acyltransferase YncA
MIRDAVVDDLPTIAAITAHYVAHTAIHFAYQPPTVDELTAAWEAARDRHAWLVATDDGGAVVGYAKSDRFRARAAYDRSAEVGVYLAPDVRGRGRRPRAGRRADRAAGRRRLPPRDRRHRPAQPGVGALFEGAGFTAVGVFREVGWKFDAWHDVGFWQRRL